MWRWLQKTSVIGKQISKKRRCKRQIVYIYEKKQGPKNNLQSGNFPMKEKRKLPKCTFSQVTISLNNLLHFFIQGLAAALGPQPILTAALGLLAYTSRSARPPMQSAAHQTPNLTLNNFLFFFEIVAALGSVITFLFFEERVQPSTCP